MYVYIRIGKAWVLQTTCTAQDASDMKAFFTAQGYEAKAFLFPIHGKQAEKTN